MNLSGAPLDRSEHPAGGASARLHYERLRAAHATELCPCLTDPRVYEYISGRNPSNESELIAQFRVLEAGPADPQQATWWNFVVREASCGRAMGLIQATIAGNRAEIAYLFGWARWDHGFATESLQWLHGELVHAGVRETWAAVAPGNSRSIRVLQRLGYRPVAEGWPKLASYERGDSVFCRQLAVQVSRGVPPR